MPGRWDGVLLGDPRETGRTSLVRPRRVELAASWRLVEPLRLFRPGCLAAVMLVAAFGLAGCNEPIGEYLPVSAIARGGFVTDQRAVADSRRWELRLRGFVDHGNLYGDAGAKEVLGE